jgi:hypothetical protein
LKKTALLFSGHNQRAVVALCRYFVQAGQDFAIVSAGKDDSIHLTDYKKNVVLDRQDTTLSVDLFADASRTLGRPLICCPTSEFLNFFIFDHAGALAKFGVETGMPERPIYERLTGKKSSQRIFHPIRHVRMPVEFPATSAQVPCILKPYANVTGGKVLYPIICITKDQLDRALRGIDPEDYFVQSYVDGQSYYLCGYLKRDGAFSGYWQENLLQQPGGKSIVLARTCPNPGLDQAAITGAISSMGYHGPLMVELIRSGGEFFYIETNPRFWGPLQLALSGPDMLSLYLEETFDGERKSGNDPGDDHETYYAWKFGAAQPGLKMFPAATNLANLDQLIDENDVFRAPDTIALHGKY